MLVHRRVTLRRYPFIHLGGQKHYESKVSCPRTQCSDPARARTRTARSGIQRNNHQATAPPTTFQWTFFAWAVCFPITDHVIFSREFVFYPHKIYSFIYTRLFENLRARILKSIITWSVMGQQNAPAKKIYCYISKVTIMPSSKRKTKAPCSMNVIETNM